MVHNNPIFQTTYRGIQISCETGDITLANYGAIVVSTDSSFSLNAGAGRSVLRAGGHVFQQNLSQSKTNHINTAILSVQAAGTLQANYVILAALRGNHRQIMAALYQSVIDEAVRLNVNNVAIPALGCGAFGYPIDAAAEHARDAIVNSTNFGVLNQICFMDLPPGHSLYEFRDKLSSLTSPPNNQLNRPGLSHGPISFPNFPAVPMFMGAFVPASQLASPFGLAQSASMNPSTAFLQPTSAQSTTSGPSPPKKKRTTKKSSKSPPKQDEKDVLPYKILDRSELPKPTESEKAMHSDEDPFNQCSICLSDLDEITSTQGSFDDPPVELTKCTHLFHKSCIDSAFKVKPQCPNCMTWYAPAMGNQPKGGTMRVTTVQHGPNCGFLDAHGYIQIDYQIPGGVQTNEHPRPGVPFSGTHRTAFLPNNRVGNEVLRLLQMAFDRRLIFTVGDSVTSGRQNTVVWNNIHHKTSLHGGAQSYGYPDEDYLRRVKEELAAVGIRAEMLDDEGRQSS